MLRWKRFRRIVKVQHLALHRTKSHTTCLSVLSKCFLYSDRIGAVANRCFLGKPVLVLNHPLGEKNLFPTSNINLPWLSFILFPQVERLVLAPLRILRDFPCENVEGCGEVSSHSPPGWTDQMMAATPHTASPPGPSPSLCPSFGCSLRV